MRLKQLTTFRPFMGQFVMFSFVALSARYHDVIWIVRSAARQRDNMINMVDFSYLFSAVIAATFLALILMQSVIGSVISNSPALSRSIPFANGASHLFSVYGLFIYALSLAFCRSIVVIFLSVMLSIWFGINTPSIAACLIAFFGIVEFPLPMLFKSAFPARIRQMPMSITKEIDESFWKEIAAFVTAFEGKRIVDHSILTYAASQEWCGQGSVSTAFSRSYSLDHECIIPQKEDNHAA